MRTFLSVTLFLSIAFLTFGQTKDEDRDRQRIADNKIKSITQWTHRFSGDKPSPTGHKTSVTQYDKNGNAIEIVNYRPNGEISSRLLYKYNNQNLRTEYVQYQKLNKPTIEVSYKQTFHYNSKGLKTHESVFDGATGYRITYEYYPDDKLKEIVKYGAGNKVDERWIYSYKDNVQETSIFKPDKVLSSRMRKEYDGDGNLLLDIRLDDKGNELKRIVYSYDSKGRMTEAADYYSGNFTQKLEYLYNSQGMVIEVIQNKADGTRFTQSKYQYDSTGNLVEERWSEGQAQDFSHKQSRFDSAGSVLETDSYFAPYRYRVLYKYTYEYH
jgi:YD repeat-containing protein